MNDISREISSLKEKLGSSLCVMGHHYQADDVAEHCDIMGDSLELARKMENVKAEHVIFCGVYFMGETSALLARPGQKVYLPEPDADCMMSLMASARLARSVLEELGKSGRKVIPVAYVNTMLELKDLIGEYGGTVCTSANAEKVLAWALKEADTVLFLPDRHLGRNTALSLGVDENDQYTLRLTGKGLLAGQEEWLNRKLLFWPGCCAVHARLKPRDIENAIEEHPEAIVLAHPECSPEVIEKCDGNGSTSYLIKEAASIASSRPGATVIIGTEENLVNRLADQYRESITIKPLGRAYCPHMAKVTPQKLLDSLEKIASGKGEPVTVKDSPNARKAILKMLEICS